VRDDDLLLVDDFRWPLIEARRDQQRIKARLGGEIGERVDRRDDKDRRLQRRQISVLTREHQEAAEAREREW